MKKILHTWKLWNTIQKEVVIKEKFTKNTQFNTYSKTYITTYNKKEYEWGDYIIQDNYNRTNNETIKTEDIKITNSWRKLAKVKKK